MLTCECPADAASSSSSQEGPSAPGSSIEPDEQCGPAGCFAPPPRSRAPGDPSRRDGSPSSDEEDEEEGEGCNRDLSPDKVGTDAFCEKWYWGHADSSRQPPEEISFKMRAMLFPLKALPNQKFYHQFAEYVLWPSYLDSKARGAPAGRGCPFLGGTAYLRHSEVKDKLARVSGEHASGAICRRNELGYLLLQPDAFPGSGCLGLGNPVETKRIQRKWLEHFLSPDRLPDRDGWFREAAVFLAQAAEPKGEKRQAGQFKVRREVTAWWHEMLWRHVVKIELPAQGDSKCPYKAFGDFQMQWLQSAVLPAPNFLAEKLRMGPISKKVWSIDQICEAQRRYREIILRSDCVQRQVPGTEQEVVAQAILEMFVFAGGLSVPQTIHSGIAVLFTPDLLPSPFVLDRSNVESFVYEVTRLFPAVQGFCYWRGGNREILSLNAALRDPAVWGKDCNRFTLKAPQLYRAEHVGFANQARGQPGTFDSKACPGIQLTLDVCQAFLLALVAPERSIPFKTISPWISPQPRPGQERRRKKKFWRPLGNPKPEGVQGRWWKDFVLQFEDWLDGDQTGEELLMDEGLVELGRLLHQIDMCDSTLGSLGSVLKALGPKGGVDESAKIAKFDLNTRIFFEVSRKQYKELSTRATSAELDRRPRGPFERFMELEFADETPNIQLPAPSTGGKRVRDSVAMSLNTLLEQRLCDEFQPSLAVRSHRERLAAIMLCQMLFRREVAEQRPPNSTSRPDSFLPKATFPFKNISGDQEQAAIAWCGIGQLFLRENRDHRLRAYGGVICDVSALGDFGVRDGFERLGASAFFCLDGGHWKITAIDWRHRSTVVTPKDPDWEHAKWVWRCSLVTYITVVNHLMWTHWIISNSFATSIYETLDVNHPVRRLLQVHTYKTQSINHHSALSLYPQGGMLHRMSPFPYEELQRVFATAAAEYRFQTWPEEYESFDLPNHLKDSLPIFQDGLDLWRALNRWVSGYIGIFFRTDADVQGDPGLQEYWKFSRTPLYAAALGRPLSKASLTDQITRAIFDVTAMHEFVGGVVGYTTDPAGAALQVRPGLDMAGLQQFVQVNSLVAGTGMPMPMMIPSGQEGDEDWLPQLLLGQASDERVKKLHAELMRDLHAVSAAIGKRNSPGARIHPFEKMDPLTHERSLSL
jgi:hypothetical protein